MDTQLKINKTPFNICKCIKFKEKRNENIDVALDLIKNGQSIVYFSDTHSNVSSLPMIAGFINFVQNKLKHEDLIKICAGDFLFGEQARNASVIMQIFNKINLTFLVTGNHEFDLALDKLKNFLDTLSMPVLGVNIRQLFPKLPLKNNYIFKANNQKYGAIGITIEPKDKNAGPVDINITETVKIVQKEVDKITECGINRIVLTSHLGKEQDKQIAQQTSGIDVIISSHDHTNINGVDKNENIFCSKINEPVVILQASENGNSIGYARFAFNSKGLLTKVYNKVFDASDKAIPEDKKTLDILSNSISLKPLGKLVNNGSIKNINLEENPLANWIADTIKNELKTPDAVIFDSRIIRTGLNAGKIREFNIDEMLPLRKSKESECFKTVSITGKQIKELLSALTNVKDQTRPLYIAEVSGLKYSINDMNQVENIKIESPKGKFEDVKDYRYYKIALQDFIIGARRFEKFGLNQAQIIENHHKTPQELIKNYLFRAPHIIKLNTDQRIDVRNTLQEHPTPPNYLDLKELNF